MAKGHSEITRRCALLALPAALMLALAPVNPAQAAWPEKPIKLVLPFGPGGVADVTSRIMADKLSQKFGQRVVIENMPGPGGIAAARAVISAAPDGYTMALVTNGTAISVAAFKSLPFDPVKDFEMVSMVGTFDLVFVVNAASEYKTLGDFIKAAKAQARQAQYRHHLASAARRISAANCSSRSADLNVQIVPYKTSPDIVVALLRNDVQMMIDFPPAVQGQVDRRQSCAFWRSPARSARRCCPDIPTVDEAGVKGYEVISWNGVGAPKGTPKEIIDTMNKAMHEVLAMPEVKSAIRQGRRRRACRARRPELMDAAHLRHQEMGRGHREGGHSEEVDVGQGTYAPRRRTAAAGSDPARCRP